MDTEKIYEKLMLIENLSSMSIYEAKNYIGQLVDISFDSKKKVGLKKAIKLNEELLKRDLPDKYKIILNYFMAKERKKGSGLEMTHFPLILACC